jgi:hypothetical protein
MSYSYYIYYRVDPAQAKTAEPRIKQLLATVEKATGITGRLMTKRGEPDLWMEVYEGVADEATFEWELAAAVNECQATGILQAGSGRHIECFET